MYLIIELFHVANPAKYGPAGGTSNFQHALLLIGQLAGMVAAVLIGTSAATEDLSSGVFRELVATGRPRTQLFLARIPGGLALLLPLVALAYALCAVLTASLAGGNPTPSLTDFVEAGLWAGRAAGVLDVGLALGARSAAASAGDSAFDQRPPAPGRAGCPADPAQHHCLRRSAWRPCQARLSTRSCAL